MTRPIKVLFLCTGNSCRSQMAEGWVRHLRPEWQAYSAGIERHGLNPLAVKVMAEVGIDISQQQSKTLDQLSDVDFDLVVTVCDSAATSCPVFRGPAKVVHHSFDDPPALAAHCDTEAEALVHYRRVRDAIKNYIVGLPTHWQPLNTG